MAPRKPTPKVGDLILLRWLDISESPEWQDSEHPEGELHVCESVGWVVKVTPKIIVLTRTYGTHSGSRTAGDVLTLPRGCVDGFEVLRGKV